MLSFIWPAYFYLKIKGDKLSPDEIRFNRGVIVTGLIVCVVGVYYSLIELINATQFEPE